MGRAALRLHDPREPDRADPRGGLPRAIGGVRSADPGVTAARASIQPLRAGRRGPRRARRLRRDGSPAQRTTVGLEAAAQADRRRGGARGRGRGGAGAGLAGLHVARAPSSQEPGFSIGHVARETVHLFAAEPDLLAGLGAEAAAEARSAVVAPVETIDRGTWSPE